MPSGPPSALGAHQLPVSSACSTAKEKGAEGPCAVFGGGSFPRRTSGPQDMGVKELFTPGTSTGHRCDRSGNIRAAVWIPACTSS